MEMSFNCCVLSSDTSEIASFPLPIVSDDKVKFVNINGKKIILDNLTVGYLKEFMCPKLDVSAMRAMKLWKINVKKSVIKDEVSTENDIIQKLNGKEMEPEELFKEYFRTELDNQTAGEFVVNNIHIFTIITATATGQKRSADPEYAETGPKRPKRSVYNQKDLEQLISEIEGYVNVGPPPELYPELSKNIAGRFQKQDSLIPISGKSFPDMRLTEQFVTPMGEKLISLFKGKENFFQIIYGVSGAGKTRAIFDMARSLFVIYIDCAPPRDETMAQIEPTYDANLSDLVEKLKGNFADLPIDKAVLKADYHIVLEFIARVIYLILLKKAVKDLKPLQYLLAQINGGQRCIAKINYCLETYEFEITDLKSIFRIALEQLEEQFGERPIFAIDEANLAITKYFFGSFKNLHGKPRGLLTPMVVFLFKQRVPIVISGTSFSLEQGESVLSNIGKGVTNEYLDEFGSFTIENVESYLENLLDLSGCDLKSIEEFECLAGRPRFASRLVVEIIRVEGNCDKTESKQDVLKEAIEATIKAISERLKSTLEKFINVASDGNDSHGWRNTRDALFIGCQFFGGYVSRYEIDDRERKLIDSGIVHLSDNNKKSLVIDELLAVKVVKNVLLPSYQNPNEALLQKLTAELKRKATNVSDTSKGHTWQYLAQAKLMSLNGTKVADFVHTIYDVDDIFEIGGIRKTNLPEWTKKAIFKIKSFGELAKLSWQLRNEFGKFEDDVDFIEILLENPKYREYMLDPNIIMRPDGVYIGNNIDRNDDYWTLLISAKLYGTPLTKKGIHNDKRTTEWKYVYYEDGENENTLQIKKHIIKKKLDTVRNRYTHQGSIRIHFILPGLAESKDKAEDRGGCRVEGNDIIMYIDQKLLNKYFKNSHYVDVIDNIL